MTAIEARGDARPGAIAIRGLRAAPDDYGHLARWLSDPRVLAFYGGRDRALDLEGVERKYAPRIRGEEPVEPCLIELDGQPIGYLQYYRVQDPREYELDDAEGVWGMDLFIGEPELWSRGYGSAAVDAVARRLVEGEGAARVVIDPHVANPRAIRAYEKAGFRRVKVLREHEWHEGRRRDCWLMVREGSRA